MDSWRCTETYRLHRQDATFFLKMKGALTSKRLELIILILDVTAQKTWTVKIKTSEITNLAIIGQLKQSAEKPGSELLQLLTRSLAGYAEMLFDKLAR